MIFEEHIRPGAEMESLISHLTMEMLSACSPISVHPDHAADVARAVATYIQKEARGAIYSSEYISVLLARALRGSGLGKAAVDILSGRTPAGSVSILSEKALHHASVSPSLWRAFSSKLVRETRWVASSGHPVWILDLARLNIKKEECLELGLLPCLRSLISGLAGIWDDSLGAGMLGIRNLSKVNFPDRKRTGSRRVGSADLNLIKYCGQVLDRIKGTRGWNTVPRVIGIDDPVFR